MSKAWSRVGCQATIVRMDHSPASTCAHRSKLIGCEGLVVAVLRNGGAALLRLDNNEYDLPHGVRRWVVAWDDLELHKPVGASKPPAYVVGFSKKRHVLRYHAVVPGGKVAICSASVKPLPFCGWSLAFSPTTPRACSECLALLTEGTVPAP